MMPQSALQCVELFDSLVRLYSNDIDCNCPKTLCQFFVKLWELFDM